MFIKERVGENLDDSEELEELLSIIASLRAEVAALKAERDEAANKLKEQYPCIEADIKTLFKLAHSPEFEHLPTNHRLALGRLFNLFDELASFAIPEKAKLIEWLNDEATDVWGDLGASEEIRNEAHRKLGAVYEFLSWIDSKTGSGYFGYRPPPLPTPPPQTNEGQEGGDAK